MALDGVVSSPHKRSQSGQNVFSLPSVRKPQKRGDEFESWSALFQRHRFLLTALSLLAFLCTIYLYFAITFGASELCSGLKGAAKAMCHVEQAKSTMATGKLKFY